MKNISYTLLIKEISWPRFIRRFAFTLLVTLLMLYLGLAWIYADALIYPACTAPIPLPEKYPKPIIQEIVSHDGINLDTWYYPSQNGAAVVAMGGMDGSLGRSLPPVEPLLDAGYGVLQIESRACAQPPVAVTLGHNEAFDAQKGLQLVMRNFSLDANRIGVIGFSMGSVAAIRVAANDSNFSAVVAEGGYFNLGMDIVEADAQFPPPLWQRPFLYSVAAMFWLQTRINPWEISPVDDLQEISPRPVFLIYGEHEVDAGRAWMQYAAAEEPKSIWIVLGGDHGTNHIITGEKYGQQVVTFFNQALLGE